MQASTLILDKIIDDINYSEPSEEDEFDIENYEQEQVKESEKKSSKDPNVEHNFISFTRDVVIDKASKRGSGAFSRTPNTASNSSGGDGSNKKIGTIKSKLTTSSRVYKAAAVRPNKEFSNDNLRNMSNQNYVDFSKKMMNSNLQSQPLRNDGPR